MKVVTAVASVTIAAFFAIGAANESCAADFNSLYPVVNGAVSSERAYEYTGRIWQYDKWSTFPMWQKSSHEALAIMNERGLDDAEVVNTPADGTTKYGDWTNPIGWDCSQATLEIIEPAGLPEKYRYLCNFRINPSCLTFFAAPTPPEGIEAEIAILDKPNADALKNLNARGKIILVNQGAGYLKKFLDANGVPGILSDQPVGPYDTENCWLNTWSDTPGGWLMHGDDSRNNFSFSISEEKGRYIRNLIASGTKVRVRAVIDSRYLTDGKLPYVTGCIKGTGDQEVLVGGHLFEWGAGDNASGCAVMLETLGTLNELIRSGALPRPKRTIRLWMGHEMYGSLPFSERFLDNLRRTVAAVICDTPAPDWDSNAATIKVFMNPTLCPNYADAVYPEFWRSYYSKIRANKQVLLEPFEGGTDTYFAEKLIGAPTTFVYMENGTWLHHNSRDTMDKIDKRSLRDLCMVNALYLYFMADAGYDNVDDIARLTYDYGVTVINEKTAEMKQRAESARDGAELGRILYDGVRAIDHYTGIQKDALASILRLVEPEKRVQAKEKTDALAKDIGDIGALSVKQFKEAVSRAAKAKGVKAVAFKPVITDRDKEMDSLFPKATKIGTLTLEGIPPEKWVAVTNSPRWWSTGNWAAASYWWCDGTHSLREIKDFCELATGRTMDTFDILGYYRFLEQYGYVDFVK